MTYLPVAKGIDLVNPDSSLHLGWNEIRMDYNVLIDERAYQLDLLYKQNNWDQSRIQKEIRNLQSEIKNDLKKGKIKCH